MARYLVGVKQYQQALKFYNKALAINPKNSDLLIEIARVNGWADNNKIAAEYYLKVLKITPYRKDDVMRSLGWQLLWSKQPDKAASYFNDYLSRHPNDPDAKQGLLSSQVEHARNLNAINNFGQALIYYKKALTQKPNDTDLLIETARVESWAGHNKQALELYQRVLSIAPQRKYDVLRPMAWQYLWIGQPKESQSIFAEYLKMHSYDENATLGYARSLEEQKKFHKASYYYKQVINIDPQNVEARHGLARIHLTHKSYHQAKKTYQEISQLKPDDIAAKAGIIRAKNLSGQHRQAAKEYSELLSLYPDNSEYFNELAYAQSWAGFDDLALGTLENAPPEQAKPLKEKLLRNLGNPFTLSYDGSTDSDNLNINAFTVSAGKRISPETLINAIYRLSLLNQNFNHRDSFDQPNQSFTGNEGLIGFTTRFGSLESPWGVNWPTVLIGGRGYGDWQSFSWKFRDKWIPSDLWRIDIWAGNEAIENIGSIQNHILYTSVFGSVDFRPHPRIILTAGTGIGEFSDDNVRQKSLGRFAYSLFFIPQIIVGAEASYFTDSKPNLDHGYYNPNSYWEAKFIGGLAQDICGLLFRVDGGVGEFGEDPGQSGNIYIVESSIERYFNRFGSLRAYIGTSQSAPAISTPQVFKPGYQRTYWGLSYFQTF